MDRLQVQPQTVQLVLVQLTVNVAMAMEVHREQVRMEWTKSDDAGDDGIASATGVVLAWRS
jgi:hypothetical protein